MPTEKRPYLIDNLLAILGAALILGMALYLKYAP